MTSLGKSMKKLIVIGATVLSFVFAPTLAFARDRDWRDDRGYRDGYYGRGYDGGHYRHKHRGDDDALIAGVAGLAIGAILGSALSQRNEPRYAPPPQGYYGPPPPRDGYDDDGYYGDDGYGGGYQSQCFRRELVWDPRLRRNVEVTHPIPC